MSAANDTREHDTNVKLAIALSHSLGTPGLELLMYDLARVLREQLARVGLRLVDVEPVRDDEWPEGPIPFRVDEPIVEFARPVQ